MLELMLITFTFLIILESHFEAGMLSYDLVIQKYAMLVYQSIDSSS